jgi:hypothetical protein
MTQDRHVGSIRKDLNVFDPHRNALLLAAICCGDPSDSTPGGILRHAGWRGFGKLPNLVTCKVNRVERSLR